jgi:hypothetical protein
MRRNFSLSREACSAWYALMYLVPLGDEPRKSEPPCDMSGRLEATCVFDYVLEDDPPGTRRKSADASE